MIRATSRSCERMPKTPHIRLQASVSSASGGAEQPVAADDAEPPQRHAAEPVDDLGPARDDRLAAALAEPGARVVGQLELGAEAGVDRGLGERDREPALGHVVQERALGRRPPEELDERGLGGEVEPGRLPARLAVARLVLRAGERDPRRAGEQDHVARLPGAAAPARTSGTSPTQPTTGVGWIARPSVSL